MHPLLRNATLALSIGISCSLAACSSPSPTGNAAATAGATGSTVGCNASDGDVYAAGLEKPGTAGQYHFALVSSTPAPPAVGDDKFVVQVIDADDQPIGGNLSVVLEMPEHGHMSMKQPEISFDPESNTFTLDPMNLFMVGLWRITFSFEGTAAGAPLSDSAVFEFCID